MSAVLGIGIDLIEIERMQQVVQRWGDAFLTKVFTATERAYCDSKAEPWRHYAGRFAVKEAVSKAFGTGIGKELGWLDIEVTRSDQTGAPGVRLSARSQAWAESRGVRSIFISVSHTHRDAVAQALLSGEAPS